MLRSITRVSATRIIESAAAHLYSSAVCSNPDLPHAGALHHKYRLPLDLATLHKLLYEATLRSDVTIYARIPWTVNNHANQEHSLCRVQHQYSTRSVFAGRYEVPRISNYYGDRTIKKRLPYVLNTMPVDIRQETHKLKFKNKLRNYLLDNIV
ncbi:hypothetical protein ACJJTC_003222 [Scirpophaga incertulas]